LLSWLQKLSNTANYVQAHIYKSENHRNTSNIKKSQ